MKLIPNYLTSYERYFLTMLAECSGWEPGRQGTGYEKLDIKRRPDPLLRTLIRDSLARHGIDRTNDHWDAVLLRYPPGSYIPRHRDEASIFGLTHQRLNAIVTKPNEGGVLIMAGQEVPMRAGDAILFRPDAVDHEVTTCGDERLIFSVGCWL